LSISITVQLYIFPVNKVFTSASFHKGDIIVINPYLKPEHNDYVVVSSEEGEEATFNQLKKYGRTRVLHPLNPKYDDIELRRDTERVVGVVIEKKKRYR
jgi:SOS-response transcriptional repressor LexA